MRREEVIPKHVRIRNKYLGLSIAVGVVIGSAVGFLFENPATGIIPGVVAGVVGGTIIGNIKAKPYIEE
ncbi:hypothetical protein [Paenibacillus sp. MBLB4367]|uniref:hypothetical protein n=1 Tax=Paenibacillus sp. MBLB4367 TaxID=3384767 RepID=UPI003907FCF3